MKTFIQLLSVLVAFCSFVTAEEVITLTQKNFQEAIDNNPYILVEFYAPWCGHCKKLAPEYEAAAVALKGVEPKIVLAKVDATEENDLASKYGVKGFPTLKWFVNGQVSDYKGGRTEATIVSWVKKKSGPPATVLKTVDDLKKFRDEADAVAVGFFADETEAATFIKNAQMDDETPYGVCYGDCAALKTEAGAGEKSKLIVLQKFDDGKEVFDGDHTSLEEVATFVSANSLPTIIQFSQQTAPKIFNGPIKSQLLFFVDSHDHADAKKIFDDVRPVAKKLKNKLMFVSVQKSDTRILEFFGVTEKDIPTARIVKMDASGAKKYKFTAGDLNAKNVESFAEDYFAGNLNVDLKSEEPIPESEQGNVRVVVGKDFEQVVGQKGKDVLVEFYAPWCGHCKKLEPEYNELGEHFKDNDNIIIAKVDATANEVERVSVTGFPTIKFFPADSDEIVDYDGERTKDGMITWLKKHAKNLQ